jgi:hypothetical protein
MYRVLDRYSNATGQMNPSGHENHELSLVVVFKCLQKQSTDLVDAIRQGNTQQTRKSVEQIKSLTFCELDVERFCCRVASVQYSVAND